jgi:hypothetical protein
MTKEENNKPMSVSKKIAGCCFVRNAILFDYCIEASINSMKAFCDVVYVCYVEGEDETLELLKSIGGITLIVCKKDEWDKIQGREKLALFQNVAINQAQIDGYEYCFLCQADECVSQDSIPHIRQAVELGEEGYCVTRHNLWADEHHMLNVRQDRSPVSTVVNRLTKTCYRSYGDGESILSNSNLNFINKIEIFHMGFIRDNKKHIAKIKEIQQNIFQIEYDKRADLKEEFDWKDWGFTDADLVPIHKPLPIYLKDWILKLNK